MENVGNHKTDRQGMSARDCQTDRQDRETRRRAQLEEEEAEEDGEEHVEDDDEADRYRRSSRQGHGRGCERLKIRHEAACAANETWTIKIIR